MTISELPSLKLIGDADAVVPAAAGEADAEVLTQSATSVASGATHAQTAHNFVMMAGVAAHRQTGTGGVNHRQTACDYA